MLDTRPAPRLVAQPAPGLPVARLVLGKPVDEVEALLPRLFNLCRGAQAAAVSAALGRADDGTAAAEIARDVLRDHLLKLHASWPALLGLAPRALPDDWRAGGHGLLAALFGPDAEAPATPAAFDVFLASNRPAAVPLACIAQRFAPGEAVSEGLPAPDGQTLWRRGACENSVAARHLSHPVMRALEASHGRGPLWRAAARLYDIEAAALGRLPALEVAKGRVLVPAARGTYAIHMQVENGHVTGFERVTPTDALLAQGGILARSLATLPAEKTGLGALLLDILDPCSPVRLREVIDA